MDKQIIFYIIVNSDLKMTNGQIAAQISHLTQIITEEIIRAGYENFNTPKYYINYMKWKKNPITIILKASETELIKLLDEPDVRFFYDSGKRLGENCLTTIGFFPSDVYQDRFSSFQLL